MNRTILIMAGGTGGHVFPGLAVADCLRAQGWRVVWMGSRSGMEANLVPAKGYEMAWINFSGARGKGLARLFLVSLQFLPALFQSAAAIFRHRPHVVLGLGGYVAFPGGVMAWILRKPLVIHEQNSIAGLANRWLSKIADKVLAAFPGAFSGFTPEVVGNPVRPEIASLPPPDERFRQRNGRLRLLVIGGSLGAQILNETVPAALRLIPESNRPQVVHQAGAKHVAALKAAYAAARVHAAAVPFIEDMAAHYAESDLVVCRSGALTIAELACAGVAAVLVPFPHAVDDHQTCNARYLSERGAAVLLPQRELNAEKLARTLSGFTREILLDMAKKARALAKPDATQAVARACISLGQAA